MPSDPNDRAGAMLPLPMYTTAPSYTKAQWSFKPDIFFGNYSLWRAVESTYLMAVAANAAYCRSRPDLADALRDFMLADSVTFFHSSNPLVPDCCVFIFPDQILISVAGTTNVAQWAGYVFSGGVQADIAGVPGASFDPFRTAADVLYGLISDFVRGNSGLIYLTGHSLGGAVAWLLGRRFSITARRLVSTVWSYGAPRPGDIDLRDNQGRNGCMTRVQIAQDPVSAVPPAYFLRNVFAGGVQTPLKVPARFFHPKADQVALQGDGIGYQTFLGYDEDKTSRDVLAGIVGALTDAQVARYHAIARYLDRLEANIHFQGQINLTRLQAISAAMVAAGL